MYKEKVINLSFIGVLFFVIPFSCTNLLCSTYLSILDNFVHMNDLFKELQKNEMISIIVIGLEGAHKDPNQTELNPNKTRHEFGPSFSALRALSYDTLEFFFIMTVPSTPDAPRATKNGNSFLCSHFYHPYSSFCFYSCKFVIRPLFFFLTDYFVTCMLESEVMKGQNNNYT